MIRPALRRGLAKKAVARRGVSIARACRTFDASETWVGKDPSLSNARWLKRALGAALKRDRSNFPFLCLRQKKHLTLCCGNSNNIGTACACMTRSRRATILTPPPSVAHCLGHSSCNAWRRAWRACVLPDNNCMTYCGWTHAVCLSAPSLDLTTDRP